MDALERAALAAVGEAGEAFTLSAALERLGFREPAAAEQRLRQLEEAARGESWWPICVNFLLSLLGGSPYPDQTLVSFERFVRQLPAEGELLSFLGTNPRGVEILIRVFVGSQYLTDTLLRQPQLLIELTRHQRLAEMKSREDYLQAAREAVAGARDFAGQANALRRWHRGEMLRIGTCDMSGLIDFRGTTNQLSLLADGTVECALRLAQGKLDDPCENLSVLAFGKLGGEELNYSSDIDLVFLTDRPPFEVLSVCQKLVRLLQDPTDEGFLYRVDMRLRPWGRSGELVSTPESYHDYIQKHAELWEKQALMKARCIAGNHRAGMDFLKKIQPLIYGAPEAQVRASVRAAKGRIEAELRKKGKHWGEVKSGKGSIRDIEFTTQLLQLVHGDRFPGVVSRNTLDGLIRIADVGLIQADEYRYLTTGYLFLRTVEHALQLMHNHQEHTLPTDQRELNYLARRLDFPDAERFQSHYEQHSRHIRQIFEKYVLSETPLADRLAPAPAPAAEPTGDTLAPARPLPTYAEVFTAAERERHSDLLESITAEFPARVDAVDLGDGTWRVTVLGLDEPGDLSMSCGLLFVYGFNIISGHVFTETHPGWTGPQRLAKKGAKSKSRPSAGAAVPIPRDFVNVFHVRPLLDAVLPEVWRRFEQEFVDLKLIPHLADRSEAQGELAKRVAGALRESSESVGRLLPVDVQIDNDASPTATLLRIRAEDTIGFLYELTNALALTGIAIEQVVIRSDGDVVDDTLLVTDAATGGKIVHARQREELQAAVVLIKQFTHLLPKAPNAEAALLHFRSFLQELFQQPNWLERLKSLERPEVLDALAQLLGGSDFLWEDFLRLQHSSLFPILEDLDALRAAKSRDALEAELDALIEGTGNEAQRRERLNQFKDREMFRIDMRHILGYIGQFGLFSQELTDLAEVVVRKAVDMAHADLAARHGEPTGPNGAPCGLVVGALGKCGGRELGFASDIELLFLYEHDGQTRGPDVLSNVEFYQRLVERFRQSIDARHEGIFRVDLRLRPYGRAGSPAVSLDSFKAYFSPDGPAWPFERQALVKLRPIHGDEALCGRVVALRDAFLYDGRPFDFASMRALREKQMRQLVAAGTINAKLGPGGLVDCEYLVQALQITHGREHPPLRTTNTREAIRRLRDLKLLPFDEAEALKHAYRFHRRLIDGLRMVRGDARDLTVPRPGSEEFEFLARRLGYGDRSAAYLHDLEHHLQNVLELNRKYGQGERLSV